MKQGLLICLACVAPVLSNAQIAGYALSPGTAFGVDRAMPVGTDGFNGVVWPLAPGSSPTYAFNPYFSFTTLNGLSNGVVVGAGWVGGNGRAFSVDLNTWVFTDLHPFSATSSVARGVSGAFIAGSVNNRPAAWLSHNNNPSTLPTPINTQFGEARAVSSNARFVGFAYLSSGQNRAYLWTLARFGFRSTDLTPPGATAAEANTIDFGGRVVGGYIVGNNGVPTAHIWNLSTGVNTVLLAPTNNVSAVLGTNGKWHVGVTGQRATLWQSPTHVVDLHSLLPGSFVSSVAYAIDVETTTIVGEATDKNGSRVAVYWR